MPPPNMRSILAQVHKKSLSMQSCRNFSSPASKEPKKRSDVASVVARTLGCATGLIVGTLSSNSGGTPMNTSRKRKSYLALCQNIKTRVLFS
ncbi:hypothetical protein YC2023_006694 [Brassica napus]